MVFSGNDDNSARMLLDFENVLDSGGSMTFDLPKITGQDQRPMGFDHKASYYVV